MAVVDRGHTYAGRTDRLSGERVHGKCMRGIHGLVAHREESTRGKFQHVIGAVSQHDLFLGYAVTLDQRVFQSESVAVRMQPAMASSNPAATWATS